jgi:hypothetical protein
MSKSASLEIKAKAAIALGQLQFALANKDWESAKRHAEQYHLFSQNHIFPHFNSHVLLARVGFNQRSWKATSMHFYLALMAPYGTIHRRFKNVGPGEPSPPNLTVLLLKIAHKGYKSFNT